MGPVAQLSRRITRRIAIGVSLVVFFFVACGSTPTSVPSSEPTPDTYATVEATVQERLAELITGVPPEVATSAPPEKPSTDTPHPTYTLYPTFTLYPTYTPFQTFSPDPTPTLSSKFSEAEAIARFRQYLSDSINEELEQVNTWLPLFPPDCKAPWDLDDPNCDSLAVRRFHEIDASTSYNMGVSRSRITGEYQGQGTWLLTIYPELAPQYAPLDLPPTHPGHPESKPLILWWLFESGDLAPVRALIATKALPNHTVVPSIPAGFRTYTHPAGYWRISYPVSWRDPLPSLLEENYEIATFGDSSDLTVFIIRSSGSPTDDLYGVAGKRLNDISENPTTTLFQRIDFSQVQVGEQLAYQAIYADTQLSGTTLNTTLWLSSGLHQYEITGIVPLGTETATQDGLIITEVLYSFEPLTP